MAHVGSDTNGIKRVLLHKGSSSILCRFLKQLQAVLGLCISAWQQPGKICLKQVL